MSEKKQGLSWLADSLEVESFDSEGRILKALLSALVFAVVFEGLLRRLVGGGVAGRLLFFVKDVLVVAMIPFVLSARLPSNSIGLLSAYSTVVLLFVPLILLTAFHDPVLALFGAKQYLLFPVAGFAAMIAFRNAPKEAVIRYIRRISYLIIPTSLIALYQLSIPTDHWLNLTPEGGSLEAFSAAGRLRVSSTFPFVAQFCMFLNTAVYLSAVAILGSDESNGVARLAGIASVPLLVLATFVTGSRGAVLGAAAILALASAFGALRGDRGSLWKYFGGAVVLVAMISVLSWRFPQFFEAYTARKVGTEFQSHDADVANRVSGMFTDWLRASGPKEMMIGNGLGIMSNGSQTVSAYAAHQRNMWGWGETDLANTYFEGGLYLIIIWWGFRLTVVLKLIRMYWLCSQESVLLPLAFILAYAVVTAVFGTLGIQPPLAIWWWIAVGFCCVLSGTGSVGDDFTAPKEVASPRRYRGRSRYSSGLHRSSTDANSP